jgi:RNA polymerase sigma-70 factor (ECF subfamily)
MTQPGHNHDENGDAQLLARIRQGDKAAFATLVQRHARRFYRLAYRFVHHRAEAEDMVQEAFIKLWAEPTLWQADRGASFTSWFSRIIINRCLDARRKKTSLPLDAAMELADHRLSAEQMLIDAQQHQRLEAEIARLPERQRIALNLCFNDGISNQQAADVMQLPLKALQSLLMRAKTTLKQRLHTDGE